MRQKITGCLLLLLLGWAACKRQLPTWDVDLLLPIATASLSIDQWLPDSVTKHDPSGKISIVYNQTLVDTPALALATIPDTSIVQSLKLQDMTLANNTVTHRISLGQICEQGGVTGATIIANHGSSLAVPSLNSSSPNTTSIDATSLFQSAQVQSGTMEISITNSFPIDITNFVFSLTNKSDNSLIVQDTFSQITANGGKVTHSLPLNGKKIEGALNGTILSIASPGSGSKSVIIDTAQTSVVQITLKNITVSSVTAVFPSRTLIDFTRKFSFVAGGAEIQYLLLEQGLINLEATSTLPENLKLSLSLPGAVKNGNSYTRNFSIAKGTGGAPAVTTVDFDLAGYLTDMRGGIATGSNQLQVHVLAAVDSTGQVSTISNTDSLQLKFSLKGISPAWGQGYFGKHQQLVGPASVSTAIFNKISSGKFELGNLTLSLNAQNGIGINSAITLSQLDAVSPGGTTSLAGSMAANPLSIGRALDKPYRPVGSVYKIDQNNSNITKLIESRPTRINYTASLDINNTGNVLGFRDFFYKNSRLKLSLGVEAPLAFYAERLTLTDTVKITPGNLNKNGKLNSLLLKIMAENGFPIEATLSLTLLDAAKTKVDELFMPGNNTVAAGTLTTGNPTECRPEKSSLTELLTEERIARFEQAKFVVITALLQTRPGGVLQLYDYWKLNLKLVADANITAGGN